MITIDMEDRLVTLGEAAQWLRLSRSTLIRLLLNGAGPPITPLGVETRISLRGLVEWEASRS